jgi:hypothetical protein
MAAGERAHIYGVPVTTPERNISASESPVFVGQESGYDTIQASGTTHAAFQPRDRPSL